MRPAATRRDPPVAGSLLEGYRRACQELTRDLLAAAEDLAACEAGGTVEYFIDFSELYAFVTPWDQRRRDELLAFPWGDPSDFATAEDIAIEALFSADRRFLITASHFVELQDFLRRAEHVAASADEAALDAPLRRIETDPLFKELLRTIQPGSRAAIGDWRNVLDFLEANALEVVQCLQRSESDTQGLQRLAQLLRGGGLRVYLPGPSRSALDVGFVDAWFAQLNESRRQQRKAASRVDAWALAELAYRASQDAHATRLILISRSTAMHSAARRLAADGHNAEFQIRHPRQIVVFEPWLRTLPTEDRDAHVKGLLSAVNLFLSATQSQHVAGEAVTAVGVTPDALLEPLREKWRSIISLALYPEGGHTKRRPGPPVGTPGGGILLLAHSLDSVEGFRTALRERLRQRSDALRSAHASCGALVAHSLVAHRATGRVGQCDDQFSGVVYERRDSQKAVLRAPLERIPFSLQLFSEPAIEFARLLQDAHGLDASKVLSEVAQLLEGGADPELILALAYVLAAEGRWDIAAEYCEHVLRQGEVATQGRFHEARLLLAVCLRKTCSTLSCLRRAYDEVELGQAEKAVLREDRSYLDPRFLVEKGTIVLHAHEMFPSEAEQMLGSLLEGISHLERALSHIADDVLLRMVARNNLICALTLTPTFDHTIVAEHVRELKEDVTLVFGPNPSGFVLDTVGWATFLGAESRQEKVAARELIARALDSDRLSAEDRSAIQRRLDLVSEALR